MTEDRHVHVKPTATLMTAARKLIAEGRHVTIPVKGFSMRPFLENEYDSAELAPFSQLKVGDVVLAEVASEQYVLHRIYKIQSDGIVLMGDGNIRGQESCTYADVAGKAVQFVRGNQLINPNSRHQRALAWLWRKLLPIRRYLLFMYRHFILPFTHYSNS